MLDGLTSYSYDPLLGYHPAVPPMDIRLGLTSPTYCMTAQKKNTKAKPPLRWGILACGKVAHDFTQALKMLKGSHVVTAVGARDLKYARRVCPLYSFHHCNRPSELHVAESSRSFSPSVFETILSSRRAQAFATLHALQSSTTSKEEGKDVQDEKEGGNGEVDAAAKGREGMKSEEGTANTIAAHGSYEALCNDPTVDIVYVASLHPQV
jgi:hypothetical protein